jgi:hypothetical protein
MGMATVRPFEPTRTAISIVPSASTQQYVGNILALDSGSSGRRNASRSHVGYV